MRSFTGIYDPDVRRAKCFLEGSRPAPDLPGFGHIDGLSDYRTSSVTMFGDRSCLTH